MACITFVDIFMRLRLLQPTVKFKGTPLWVAVAVFPCPCVCVYIKYMKPKELDTLTPLNAKLMTKRTPGPLRGLPKLRCQRCAIQIQGEDNFTIPGVALYGCHPRQISGPLQSKRHASSIFSYAWG